MPTVDLVIARYNEDIGWLKDYKSNPFNKIYVYNKGSGGEDCPLSPTVYEKLENVGRCDHTYIYHIIKNYDNLADVTIFAKGSVICPMRGMQREPAKFSKTVERAFETGNSVFTGKHYPPSLEESMGDFTMATYISHCGVNKDSTTKPALFPATPSPYKEWYKARFPGIKEDRASFAGIFAVSKAHIHNRKKASYEPFLKELAVDSNPEAGHFMERSWYALFHPIPESCHVEIFMQGGRKKRSTRRLKKRRLRKK